MIERLYCRHCGAVIVHRPGHGGRYRYTNRLDGTDILGSGSECPQNERGHEPREPLDDALRANGFEPCPFEEACITWIKPDDTVGLETHRREWHPDVRTAS